MSGTELSPLKESGFQLENVLKNTIQASFPFETLSEIVCCTSTLGQLTLVAWSLDDISINNPSRSTEKFEYMKYPDSLRATLLQIANSGYSSLKKAHVSMYKINFNSKEVLDLLKDFNKLFSNVQSAVQNLSQDQDRKKILKNILEELKSVAENCRKEAQGVVNCFSELNNLMEEVHIALSMTNTNIERNQLESEEKRGELEIHKKVALEKIQKQEKDVEERQTHHEDSKKALKKAIKKLPGKYERIGRTALAMFLETFRKITSNIMTFGIADAVEYILYDIKSKIPKEDGQSLVTFEIEMAKLINAEAEFKLNQAMKDKEETRREYRDLTNLSEQLVSKSKIEISVVHEILRPNIKLMGMLIVKLKEMVLSIEMIQVKTVQTQEKIPFLEGYLDIENPELFKLPFLQRINYLETLSSEIVYFSGLYVDYSGEFIIPTIRKLSKYAAIDSSDMAIEMKKLIDSTKKADQEINVIVEEKRLEMNRKLKESKK